MTICRDVESQLSQLVDGRLPDAAAQAMVREHLESCAHCRGVLQDLERLRRASRALGPIAPPDHVWLEVAGQIRLQEGSAAPLPHRLPPATRAATAQWIGLAAALLIVTTAVYFLARPAPAPADLTAGGNAPPAGTVEAVAEELSMATSHYDKAIQELEALTKSDTGALDPAVARTLQQSIQTIDHAITESRTALTQDPGSEPARESLFEALRRKVVVLQATVTLMNEMRKGNPAGAAEAAAAFGKKS
jgi:hypothetical protein